MCMNQRRKWEKLQFWGLALIKAGQFVCVNVVKKEVCQMLEQLIE